MTKVYLSVTGQTTYSDTKSVTPPALSTNQTFTFIVSNSAAIGGTLSVSVRAEDTGGNTSPTESIMLTVADKTAPAVVISEPLPQTRYNYGNTVNITVLLRRMRWV